MMYKKNKYSCLNVLKQCYRAYSIKNFTECTLKCCFCIIKKNLNNFIFYTNILVFRWRNDMVVSIAR